ncbi:MAG TPA: tetratricopeptide repeat protein [Pyrinomonadaceae bacterium]|jgi:tetratricopeptide (TPR) repeat protein
MTSLTAEEYDIFLSHNHAADEEWTMKLAERLEKEDWRGRKLRVFFSPWDIRPGQSIPLEIERALPRSRKVGLVMSPEAMASAWVELERLVTTYIAVSARQERLIPLYRRTCEIPPLLQLILCVDFRDDSRFEESYRKLLAVIKDEPLPRGSRAPTDIPALSLPLIPRPPVVGFVSRRDEQGRDIVERLEEELAREGSQLITLSGPGGVGKTTLAAEAARALKEKFGGRIVWSSAEKRTDFMLYTLLDDISGQLGRTNLRTLAPDLKAEQVRALVSNPSALIVLDNYEPIAPGAKKQIEEWFTLAQCSALFTSRHKINSTRNITIAAMSREEAEDYLERLVTQTQDAQIFSNEVRQRIYETAEANPYVMQWVVAQIDAAQEPRTVLEELAHGEGDAAERVFDRSFNLQLLGEDGRAALLALSLFIPSASREALAEVAGFANDLKRLNEALKNLRALWLIKGLEENRRFTIEGLTRSLARARLSKDERATEFRQRFVTHFLNYTEAHRQPTSEDFDALEAEKDNVLKAVDEAIDLKDWASVQGIADIVANPVAGVLGVRGYWDEAIKRSEEARSAAREMDVENNIAVYSQWAGTIRQLRGEYDVARTTNEEALAIFRKLNQEANEAAVLHQLGRLAQAQGELEEARRLYNESLEIAKKLGDQSGIAITLHNLAAIAQAQGELEEARRLYDESLEIKRKLGDQSGIAITLHQLGRLAQDQGELEEARRLYNESLEITKKLGNQSSIAITLHQLGRLAEEEGNREEAVRLVREALGIFEKLRSPNAEIARRVLKRLEGEAS